ncbi:MAG: hypothetical protein A2902_06435 [Elusimicrobia bacterium RIFCSPLOWO2_01_FULL_64_13]|nr:MAG: hypothetical protein A2636_06945 [Elusimicrobia bacterium RIFCSPHIGHO2_01_FULL_64_10]OGR96416.1 MAG: hypothetical protein A2902_06435 [Elusimicrobia bacterium RIFCSPLOWO2_01_FULL_64_13]
MNKNVVDTNATVARAQIEDFTELTVDLTIDCIFAPSGLIAVAAAIRLSSGRAMPASAFDL